MTDELPVNQPIKAKRKVRTTKLYKTSFALVKMHQGFQYRSTQAVKISAYQAVLIPSGKVVKLAADKMVKVKS